MQTAISVDPALLIDRHRGSPNHVHTHLLSHTWDRDTLRGFVVCVRMFCMNFFLSGATYLRVRFES